MIKCTASIVTYNNPPEIVRRAIESILYYSNNVEIHVVDNSKTQSLKLSLIDLPIKYHFIGFNSGYGRGHNRALKECSDSKYHVFINPDIIIAPFTLEALTTFMDENSDVGMVCPKFLHPDGSTQYLIKRYPTVVDLLIRRFFHKSSLPLFKNRLSRYEMRDAGGSSVCTVESMTGAFMFCRMDVLKKSGGFDPRYFMYFEDNDLGRKIQGLGYRTIYYPNVTVTHYWERASHKSIKMLFVFIVNGIRYFNKWGWKFY
jgi:GT2 family glycosyltransferase